MLVFRNNLYDSIGILCNGEYSIGLHSIDYRKINLSDDSVSLPSTLDQMMEDGVKVFNSGSINRIIKFYGRIDTVEDEKKVRYGLEHCTYNDSKDYIVVAVPCIFKTDEGEKIFVGSPNINSKYSKFIESSGTEETTLIEKVILSYKDDENCNIIPAEFILGRFRILDEEMVEFISNEKHMAFHNDTVSQEKIDEVKEILRHFENQNLSIKPNMLNPLVSIDNKILLKRYQKLLTIDLNDTQNEHVINDSAFLLETIEQLLKEKKLNKIVRTREKTESVKDEDRANLPIIAEITKKEYYGVNNAYVVDFYYPTKGSGSEISQFVNEYIMPQYGNTSLRYFDGKEVVMPYLIDKEGNFTISKYNSRIGGFNIPSDLLLQIAQQLIEKGCVIKIGDKEMNEVFESDAFNEMFKDLES